MSLKLDIVYMRIWAILFIVAHHSIHIYWFWPVNTDIPAISPHYMLNISAIFKSLGLSIFTCISGMLIYYQTKKEITIGDFIKKKSIRLLIPALFWGIIYHICFPLFESNKFPMFINGNHLWYLLMLFVCMISSLPLILNLRYKWIIVFILYIAGTFISDLNWTFVQFRTYFPIFILGYYFSYIKENSIFISKKIICCFLFISFIIFVLYNMIEFTNSIILFVSNIIYMMCICTIIVYTFKNVLFSKMNNTLNILNKSTFTIYILHQFVINTLIKNDLLFNYNLWYYNILLVFFLSFSIPIFFYYILNKYNIPFIKNII